MALSKAIVPTLRQFLNVRRSREAGPVVSPSSVSSMVNVSVRFGNGSPLSKIWAITSSRKSRSSPGILGCSGATSSRMNSGALVGVPSGLSSSAIG